ncbi:hypothetical protein [Paenibacillus antri]|uniref:hypothetical protein n=1 Tax=Paenibacillus antri TaxID=2582848 RepID=UPI00130530C7|nr:hypothetical protein [Paenibacillus antri]
MVDAYVTEVRVRQEEERLSAVTALAWRWFGARGTFCARCLEQERRGEARVE